jgi:tetratricopeptide (TPR) repeat protein
VNENFSDVNENMHSFDYHTPVKHLRRYLPVCSAFFFLVFCLYNNPVSAQSQADSLRGVLQTETDDSILVVTKIELSREIHRRDHDPEEEYIYAMRAVERANTMSETLLYAQALDNLGLLYRFHQKYADSFPLHSEAFQLIEALENVDPHFFMRFANNAGVAARYDQMYDLAVQYFLEALRVAEEENDLRNIAISSNGLGNTLIQLSGREDEAIDYFFRALETEIERENSLGVAINYLSISDYYAGKEQFDVAREYLNELLEVNRQRDDAFGLAITFEFFGHTYLREELHVGRALEWYHQSLESFRELDNRHKQADLLQSIGEARFYLEQYESAIAYFDSSMVLAEEMNNKQLIMANAYGISSSSEALANYADAFRYYKLASQYKDSINLIEQETEVAALQRRYDLERRDAEIELLESERNLQQAQLATQEEALKTHRIFLWLLGVGLIAILVISMMQYRNVKIKRKANQLLQKREKERLQAVYEKNLAQTEMLAARMQMNPHFLFNCLNSIKLLIQKEQNRKATRYLVVFSRFVRMVLEQGRNQVISLSDELDLIRNYLKLEENRFDNGFSWAINVSNEEELGHIFLPPLLLQPFIENAIWHGLLPGKKERKQLDVNISRNGDIIEIRIDDNGVGRPEKPLIGNGQNRSAAERTSMGMEITQKRMDLFNENYNMDINCEVIDKKDDNGKPAGTCVVIQVTEHNEKYLNKAQPETEEAAHFTE